MVAPWIPDNVPLLMDIMPNLATLKFKDFDTQMQYGSKRVDSMVLSGAQVLRSMEWAKGVSRVGLMNLLFMPHFGHSLQMVTYVKQLLVLFHRGCMWLDRP